jgi:hypothetical protein
MMEIEIGAPTGEAQSTFFSFGFLQHSAWLTVQLTQI